MGDRGAATTATLLGIGFGMLAMIGFVNFLTYQYGRGAVRSAIDQAAQAGSRASTSEQTCLQRAQETLDNILGGPLGEEVTVSCVDDGERVRVTAVGTFRGWIEVVPDYTFTETAIATKEHAP